MGKPTICICENKDADQLRGDREADQRLCFRYSDSTIPLLLKYKRFSGDFFCEMPKKFSKSHVLGTEMTTIAVEKLVSIVFRHAMFCVTQAVTSLKIGQNL